MRAKTEELLYFLLWTAETISRPTWRNMTESFEGWAYRKGLLRQLQRLENQQWLERGSGTAGDRLYRLTEAGASKRWVDVTRRLAGAGSGTVAGGLSCSTCPKPDAAPGRG